MTSKRMITLLLAALMVAVSVVSVSAATLTPTTPGGQTEVIAKIDGSNPPEPGDVTYEITIPDVVDFGTLVQPADDSEDDFKDVAYTVTLTELNNLDPDAQQVSVYVRDQNAVVNGVQDFFIANKNDPTKKFKYNVYDIAPNALTETSQSINEGKTFTSAVGYYLVGFTAVGDAVNGTLRLNQTDLCEYALNDIVGDYSGYMVFYSTVEDN